jgi:hypothetical protein
MSRRIKTEENHRDRGGWRASSQACVPLRQHSGQGSPDLPRRGTSRAKAPIECGAVFAGLKGLRFHRRRSLPPANPKAKAPIGGLAFPGGCEEHARASAGGRQREPFEAQGKQAPALHSRRPTRARRDPDITPSMCAGHDISCPYKNPCRRRTSLGSQIPPLVKSKRGSSTACPGASRKTNGAGHSAQNDNVNPKTPACPSRCSG